jgi:hypothetical protein
MLEFKHVQLNHLRVRIHRPTPHLRIRTFEDRRIVLESSLVLIEDYLGQERHRRLFYPWHGVHILFETAVVSLEACWSSRDWQPLRDQAKQMLEVSIPQCLQLLTNIGQRRNEAGLCADRLRPLVQKVSSALAGENSAPFPLYDDTSITEEIQDLLFPDGPLTWNQVPRGDGPFSFEDGSLFLDNLLVDDMKFLQWDPEWDIMPAEPV